MARNVYEIDVTDQEGETVTHQAVMANAAEDTDKHLAAHYTKLGVFKDAKSVKIRKIGTTEQNVEDLMKKQQSERKNTIEVESDPTSSPEKPAPSAKPTAKPVPKANDLAL